MSVKGVVAAVCVALALGLPAPVTLAQDVSDSNLKAAYIYRFAHFTEWPASALPPGGTLTMCVVGDSIVRDALERTVRGLTVANRPVAVVFGTPDKPLPGCHTLYVSAVSRAQAARLIASVQGEPVLTLSDLEGFNRMGGIAEFFHEAGQLRFSIQPSAVTQSRLQLSSRLLPLARQPR
jgi:hypothetical protein